MPTLPSLARVLLALVLGASLAVCAGPQSGEELGEASGGKVFLSPDGLSVGVVLLKRDPGKAGGADALVQIGGSPSEIDSLALAHRMVKDGDTVRYVMRFSGADFTTLVNQGGEAGSWTVYLPENPKQGIEVTLSEDASKNISTAELMESYEALRKAGALARIEGFDRKAVETREERALAATAAEVKEKCEKEVAAAFDWKSYSDDALRAARASADCAQMLSAVAGVCAASASAKAFVQGGGIRTVRCASGKSAGAALASGVLTWTGAAGAPDLAAAAATALRAQPAGEFSLRALISLDGTYMCLHEKSGKYVVFAPEGSDFAGVSVGDGMEFVTAPSPSPSLLGWFFDPRFFNEKNPEDHEGIDLRAYSRVEINPGASMCRVVCGSKRKAMTLLSAEDARGFLGTAQFKPGAAPPRPIAVARDAPGTHYLVVVTGEGPAASYTLYVGPPGKMKPTPVKRGGSDAEQTYAAGKAGTLHIAADKASWVVGKKSTLLLPMSVKDGASLVYGELQAFAGQRLGTPCDDL